MKTDKKEGSLFYNLKVILFMIKGSTKVCKSFPLILGLSILVNSLAPLLWVVAPKFILDELMGAKRLPVLLGTLAAFMLGVVLLEGSARVFDGMLEKRNEKSYYYFQRMMAQKAMEMDYPNLEDPKILNLKEKALHGLRYNGGGYNIYNSVIKLLSSVLSLAMLVSLVVTLHWALTLSLVVVVVLTTIVNNQLMNLVYGFWDLLQVFNRKFQYLNNLMFDFRYGKDIRIFRMKDMMLNKNEGYRRQTHDYYLGQGKREFKKHATIDLIGFFQAALIYGFTTVLTFLGKIGISSFVMYISAATSMVSTSTKMTESIIDMKRDCQYTGPFYDFCHLPTKMQNGAKAVPDSEAWEIEFKNVSFTYPGSEIPVLKEVSLKLISGQKLSIVGVNGAGKTTFVKLLLRFYDPDSGEILLNGTSIKEFDYEEYLKKFSVVFQDYQIFAGTVAENISGGARWDQERLEDAAEKANMTEVIAALPKQFDTPLYKIFDEGGVELSGGQSGRLVLARAVYKNAPFVILDEPTAALDPIAEYEIYHRFNQLVKGRTTVYISHRLSSCRFCDVIAVFDGGRLVEYGSHKELSVLENGKYAEMWKAQAQYYVG